MTNRRRYSVAALVAAFVAVGAYFFFSEEEPVDNSGGVIRKTCDAVKTSTRGIYRIESAHAPKEEALKPRFVSLDVAGMTAEEVKKSFKRFRHPERTHLWMPGAESWIVVERPSAATIPLESAMEALAEDEKCSVSFTEVFANYAGTIEEAMSAFEAPLSGTAVPEWFVTKEVPDIKWLDFGGVDEDIAEVVRNQMRSKQNVRRLILEGNMLARTATTKADEDRVTDKWAAAFQHNPHDSLLLERLNNLANTAQGFRENGKVLQAAKCYETIMMVNPNDASAIHNFGMCLKQIGRNDVAEQAFKRARELMK